MIAKKRNKITEKKMIKAANRETQKVQRANDKLVRIIEDLINDNDIENAKQRYKDMKGE